MTAAREIVVSRVLDAPRELVFRLWTDPGHVSRWWGPRGFRTTTLEMDLRPGGVWRFIMHGPDGRDYFNKVVYVEIAEPERLVYRHQAEEGSEPIPFDVTVTFEKEDMQTRLTMRMLFESPEVRRYMSDTYGAVEGAEQTLERLDEIAAALEEKRIMEGVQ